MKKLLRKILMPAVAVGVLAGCAGEEDTIIMAPVPEVVSEFSPQQQWKSSIGSGVEQYFSKLSPEYAYDKVFAASRKGLVRALDPENGRQIWQTDLEGDTTARLSGGILAAYSKLFIGSENGEVISLDEESGEELWRAKVEGEVLVAPIAESNLIIVHTARGMLIALAQESGEQRWAISMDVPNLTLRGDSRPASSSGGVFWGTANGRLAAAIVENGQLIWQQPIGMPQGATEIDRLVDVDASPLILGSTLYIVGFNGNLVSVDLRSGQPIWKRPYSSSTDITTDNRSIFLVTDKDHLVAVDARSGTELWLNNKLEHRQLTAPTIIERYLVVGDTEGYLYWIDRETGEFVSKQMVDDSGFAVGPIALDDGYAVVTRNGDIKKLTINK
ncbi:outer membrane protein assembly factor BamB [Vibrio sp. FNV 38]|nr:outer membrane protein assembly factor BamB [Vibrio sp. FNV 38]